MFFLWSKKAANLGVFCFFPPFHLVSGEDNVGLWKHHEAFSSLKPNLSCSNNFPFYFLLIHTPIFQPNQQPQPKGYNRLSKCWSNLKEPNQKKPNKWIRWWIKKKKTYKQTDKRNIRYNQITPMQAKSAFGSGYCLVSPFEARDPRAFSLFLYLFSYSTFLFVRIKFCWSLLDKSEHIEIFLRPWPKLSATGWRYRA